MLHLRLPEGAAAHVAIAALQVFFACKTPPREAEAAKPAFVTLMNHEGEVVRVEVEIAANEDARRTGLMNRTSLADDRGMIFVFPREAAQTFWMKNTLIPLDMIFIRSDDTIAGIVARAEPMTLTPRGPGVASRYVLEVNGGFAEAHHLAAGDRVKFDDVPATDRWAWYYSATSAPRYPSRYTDRFRWQKETGNVFVELTEGVGQLADWRREAVNQPVQTLTGVADRVAANERRGFGDQPHNAGREHAEKRDNPQKRRARIVVDDILAGHRRRQANLRNCREFRLRNGEN